VHSFLTHCSLHDLESADHLRWHRSCPPVRGIRRQEIRVLIFATFESPRSSAALSAFRLLIDFQADQISLRWALFLWIEGSVVGYMGCRGTPMRGSPHCWACFRRSAVPRDVGHMTWKEGSATESRVVSIRSVFCNCCCCCGRRLFSFYMPRRHWCAMLPQAA
jgi:hypothetical protein